MVGAGEWRPVASRLGSVDTSRDNSRGEPVKIEATLGDITKEPVDAIVNAANGALRRGGGVCGAIFAAAGSELDAACAAIGSCATGDAVVTPGFSLPARWIVHTVGPVWHGGGAGEPALLASCYRRSIEVAHDVGAATIAFPAISTGIFGYPARAAAEIAVASVREPAQALDLVRLVAFDTATLRVYEELLASRARGAIQPTRPGAADVAPAEPIVLATRAFRLCPAARQSRMIPEKMHAHARGDQMRRIRLVATLLILVVVGGCGAFAWRWEQRGPSRASVGGAVGRFRASASVPKPTGSLEPRPGVYLYSGVGSESLSFLSTNQGQGPTEPGTVALRPNGCWQFRIDFNSFHYQTWNRCPKDGTLTESGGTTGQRFDFVTFKMSEHSGVACDPPIVVADLTARPGATFPVHCTGRSQTTKSTFTQAGTATFVGRETVTVGRVGVAAVHTREDLLLTGGQTGQVRVDLWSAVANGLPLKEAHSIRVVSPAPPPLNQVTYAELGSWELKSLTPRT